MFEPIETIHGPHGFTAELHQDTDMGNPLEDWDVPILIASNRDLFGYRRDDYSIKGADWHDARNAYYRLRLWINDCGSSGYQVSWERIPPGFRPADELDECDAIAYTTRDRAEKYIAGKDTTPDQIWAALEADLNVWKQWLNGECYGVIVKDPTGNELDSCWGYIGYDDPREPAREHLNAAVSMFEADQAQLALTGGWVSI